MAVVNVLGVPHVYDFTPTAKSWDAHSRVIVCIHGWLLSRAYWRPITQQLTSQYGCLSYDLRGFGESIQALDQRVPPAVKDAQNRTAKLYSLAAYAEDLVVLLRQLGIQRAWLLGHSLGGSVALWAAHLAPDCIQGVVCLNAGGGIYIRSAFEQFRAAGQQMVRYRARWLQYLPLLAPIFSRMMMADPVAVEWGKRRLLDFLNADSEAALGALLASTTPAEVNYLPQLVAGLRQPIYFVTGQQDTVMLPRYVNHLASFHALFTEGNVVEFDRCGHFAMLEQPQQVVKLIESVLERHDG